MKQRLGVLLALLMFVLTARGQMDLRIGTSIGTMVSRLPNRSAESADLEAFRPHVEPRLGFIAGVNGRLTFHKNWSCVAALEYQNFGENIHGRYGTMGPQQTWIQWESWIDRRYHKLTLPVLLGYRLGKGKLRPIIQAGLRTGYFLKVSNHIAQIQDGSVADPYHEESFDWRNISRVRMQVLGSLGVEFGDNWFFGLQIANPWLLPATDFSSDQINDFDLSFQVVFRPWSLGGKAGL